MARGEGVLHMERSSPVGERRGVFTHGKVISCWREERGFYTLKGHLLLARGEGFLHMER